MPQTKVAQAAPPAGVVFRSYYYAGEQRVGMRVEGEADPAKKGLLAFLRRPALPRDLQLRINKLPVGELQH